MAHGKLFPRKTKNIKEWTISPVQMRQLLKEAPKKIGKQKIKSPGLKIDIEDLQFIPEKFSHKDLLEPHWFWHKYFCRPKYRRRKNQKNLTPLEWSRFIYAIEALADTDTPAPTYQEFVQIHVQAMTTPAGHMWGAHGGVNFLTWHREYLAKLEARLIAINPLVTIPYWNWIEDRYIPPQLNNSADFTRWGITRGGTFNDTLLPTAAQHAALMTNTAFASFSSQLEASPFHNRLHGLVGGTMGTASSPADPIFWLHHGFIDKLFADWQVLNPAATHLNPSEILKPSPIMTRTNAQVWSTLALGYVYA